MFCKYCGKKIDDDSIYCMFCGKKLKKNNTREEDSIKQSKGVKQNGTYTAPDGKKYTVRNRILYDEDGWDVGKVPAWWG